MSEISLLVVIEAGQVRSLAGPVFQIPLPDALIWGPEVLSRIESIAQEVEAWPRDSQLASAVVVDRDSRQLFQAGASPTFDTPYQLVLFDRMLSAAWGYDVQHIALTRDAVAAVAGTDPLPVDSDLASRMFSTTMGEDEDDERGEDEDDQWSGVGDGNDFRQLTTVDTGSNAESLRRQYEDQDWFVSIRTGADQAFRHYRGDFVLESFCEGGPSVIDQLSGLNEISIPEENQTTRGAVVDVVTHTLTLWSHPHGVTAWDDLDAAWPDWAIDRWLSDGYRKQLALTGEAERTVVASDLEVLADFVVGLTEQIDLKEMLGQLKSGVRAMVRRGFGCLAALLAIPALMAWAATGSWQGPVAFAATLWVIVYLAYRVIAAKMKRNFVSLAGKQNDATAILPKLAPEDKQERIWIVDQALRAAGLPSFQQVQQCAERDDEHDEPIEPMVSV